MSKHESQYSAWKMALSKYGVGPLPRWLWQAFDWSISAATSIDLTFYLFCANSS